MKNQKELEEYLESRGISWGRYVILKERGPSANDINIVVVIATDHTIGKYNLGDRYWNRITTQKVDELLNSYYTLPIITSLLSPIKKVTNNPETFEDIQ